MLEFSRVVLIIQCFAVALELPKSYIGRHWRSLFWVVGPVVIWGWMVCSLLVSFMVPNLSWKQSMGRYSISRRIVYIFGCLVCCLLLRVGKSWDIASTTNSSIMAILIPGS